MVQRGGAGVANPNQLTRLTTVERDAIASPAAGLQIFNTTTNQPNVFDGSNWISPPKDFMMVSLSAGQTSFTATEHIEFDTVETSRGSNLALSTGVGQANGIISGLKLGKSYLINYSNSFSFTSASVGLYTGKIFDITNTVDISVFVGAPPNSTLTSSDLPNNSVIYTPVADASIESRTDSATDVVNLAPNPTRLVVMEI